MDGGLTLIYTSFLGNSKDQVLLISMFHTELVDLPPEAVS